MAGAADASITASATKTRVAGSRLSRRNMFRIRDGSFHRRFWQVWRGRGKAMRVFALNFAAAIGSSAITIVRSRTRMPAAIRM
jgi:hypothetical protein